MMNRPKTKTNAFLFMALALAAILILAGGITGLELKPGEPFPLNLSLGVSGSGGALPGGDVLITIFRFFYFFCLILFPISLIYMLINKKARKQFIKTMLRLVPFVILFYFLFDYLRKLQTPKQDQPPLGFPAAPNLPDSSQSTLQFTNNPSQNLILVISLGLAFIVLLLAGLIIWQLWRRSHAQSNTLVKLAQKAQSALNELQTGGDLKNTIIRCYIEMSRVVEEQRGLRRGYSMTPHEFERLLEDQGLPRIPVTQLTQVFEDVRYGTKPAGEREERMARDSLSAIVQAVTKKDAKDAKNYEVSAT